MSVLDKFSLGEEARGKLKDEMASLLDKELNGIAGSYKDIFKQLPYEVLENMTEKQAGEFSSLVMEEALSSLQKSFSVLNGELRKLAGDEERMKKLREKFISGLEEAGKVKADIPD